MATLSNNSIARAIYLLSKEKPDFGTESFSTKVIQFLLRKRLLSQYKDILSKLQKIINRENGIIAVKVSSAEKLDEKTKAHLKQILIKRYSAKEAMLAEKVDEGLLGGLRVEVNDEVIDLTIKNKIGKLQEYLTKTA